MYRLFDSNCEAGKVAKDTSGNASLLDINNQILSSIHVYFKITDFEELII